MAYHLAEGRADADELSEHPTFGYSPSFSLSLRSMLLKIKDDSSWDRGERGRVGPDKCVGYFHFLSNLSIFQQSIRPESLE